VHVLPYIAPKYIFHTKSPTGFEKRFQLPLRFLFYPAQFWPHKNHGGLLEAISVLKEKYPDIHLVFSGAKKHGYESLALLVKQLNLENNVHFLGYVADEDIPELYRRARALIMPTFFGPTNIPPLEANALGCPVAASNIYAMKDQLGDAAIYFNPSSVIEIVKSVEQLWINDQLCQKLSNAGLERSKKWSQRLFNGKLHDIISLVLKSC
jgi:glycosyltransferase involved in cell wall biosynthesis